MTSQPTNSLSARDLLDWLGACDSRAEIHATIDSWLRANPRPPTHEDIFARVDTMLAGAYEKYGDPRPALSRRESLMPLAQSIVERMSDASILSAGMWLHDWLEAPTPALGGRCPVELLDTEEGGEQVRALLQQRPEIQ